MEDVMLDQLSSINSSYPWYFTCFFSNQGFLLFTILFTMNVIVLVPLCIFILHHGFQDWKRRCSSSSSMSHSDCFTYNMVVMELIGVSGCLITWFGMYLEDPSLITLGFYPFNLNFSGQSLFHNMTCMERYLAVMHPITYMNLKQERGVRIRNILIACVWLLCCALIFLQLSNRARPIIGLCILAFSIPFTSSFSLFVLCALIRPGPGDKSRDKKKFDRMKHKAFYTIMLILVIVMVKLSSGLVSAVFSSNRSRNCLMYSFDIWFCLPSSLVLPLLLLHRAGRFKCCWKMNQKE